MTTNRLFVDKMGGRPTDEYVGTPGELFYSGKHAGLRLADGVRAGGTPVGVEIVANTADAAYENYQNALSSWDAIVEEVRLIASANPAVTEQGWPFVNWNVNGETVAAYQAELTRIWQVQTLPSSPPQSLAWTPPISAAYYAQLRAVLAYVASAYDLYTQALASKQISGDELTVPEILQTTPDEDFILRTRTSLVTSPPGGIAYNSKDWTFKVNGTIGFPNGTTQSGAAISIEALQILVAGCADFAAFKAAIAAL